MRIRSPREYWFRAAQLVANGALWALPAARKAGEFRFLNNYQDIVLRLLPPIAPDALRQLADQIAGHHLPIFAEKIETGSEVEWRRDYVSGKTSGLDYFRFVPYLDFARVGDHKVIWELNRHQHWVVLARAYREYKDPRYLNQIRREFASWAMQNPFLKGMNWASCLEVAFRSLSWLAVFALLESEWSPEERADWWSALHQHGRYIANNLSVYFAPNTHLLGEALALSALGRTLGIAKWQALGDSTFGGQRSRQILLDGGYFEQSTYYHVYALDMFLMQSLLLEQSQPDAVIGDMAQWLACMLGPDQKLAFLGDDDGGNLFWPYGPREDFGRAALERVKKVFPGEYSCAPSTLFATTGLATFSRDDVFVLMDCGPFGTGGAGHSHSDCLSLVLRCGTEPILIDPGTYTYTADLTARDEFRSVGSHSTVRVDGADQALKVNPFRWEQKPEVEILQWRVNELLVAECRTVHSVHRREFRFHDELTIVDTIEGASGEHHVEQFWQTALAPQKLGDRSFAIGSAVLTLDPQTSVEILPAERSECYGSKLPAYRICARIRAVLPVRLESTLTFRRS